MTFLFFYYEHCTLTLLMPDCIAVITKVGKKTLKSYIVIISSNKFHPSDQKGDI